MKKTLVSLLCLMALTTACLPDYGSTAKKDVPKDRLLAGTGVNTKPSEVLDGGAYSSAVHRIVVGYVHDVATGNPIVNAKVFFHSGYTVNAWQDFMATTDDSGRYEMDFKEYGVPPFVIAIRDGYSNAGDLTDERGMTNIPSGRKKFQSIQMQKHNKYCSTGQPDFGPCRQPQDIAEINRTTSCELDSLESARLVPNEGCYVFKCMETCE